MASLIPQNSAEFSLSQVATLCDGVLHGNDAQCVGVTTDTRADLGGQLFVALRGERFDGHDYAAQALASGAAGVVVERELPGVSAAVVVPSASQARPARPRRAARSQPCSTRFTRVRFTSPLAT
jgi:UDP-N-acetylmuramyl pentapeptide synthase